MALLGLAACGTPAPARYYTLLDAAQGQQDVQDVQDVQDEPADVAPAAARGFALQMLPVRVPPAIDLPQLLVRSSDGQVVPLENDRWLGPLGDEIRGALVAQLTHALGVPEVSAVAVPQGLPVYRLQVDVTRFDTVRGRYALQDANWSLREVPAAAAGAAAADAAPAVLLCTSRQVARAADDSTPALVDAHQVALAALGRQIAQVASQPPAQWACP